MKRDDIRPVPAHLSIVHRRRGLCRLTAVEARKPYDELLPACRGSSVRKLGSARRGYNIMLL
jgi:hypothetical protein